MNEGLIVTFWAIIIFMRLDPGALQMSRETATNKACPYITTDWRSRTLWMLTLILDVIAVVSLLLPSRNIRRNKHALPSHLILPSVLGHTIHTAVDAARIISSSLCIGSDALLVEETFLPILQIKTAWRNYGVRCVVIAKGSKTNRAKIQVIVFLSLVSVGNVKIAIGLEFSLKGSHAGASCAAWIVPGAIAAVSGTFHSCRIVVTQEALCIAICCGTLLDVL